MASILALAMVPVRSAPPQGGAQPSAGARFAEVLATMGAQETMREPVDVPAEPGDDAPIPNAAAGDDADRQDAVRDTAGALTVPIPVHVVSVSAPGEGPELPLLSGDSAFALTVGRAAEGSLPGEAITPPVGIDDAAPGRPQAQGGESLIDRKAWEEPPEVVPPSPSSAAPLDGRSGRPLPSPLSSVVPLSSPVSTGPEPAASDRTALPASGLKSAGLVTNIVRADAFAGRQASGLASGFDVAVPVFSQTQASEAEDGSAASGGGHVDLDSGPRAPRSAPVMRPEQMPPTKADVTGPDAVPIRLEAQPGAESVAAVDRAPTASWPPDPAAAQHQSSGPSAAAGDTVGEIAQEALPVMAAKPHARMSDHARKAGPPQRPADPPSALVRATVEKARGSDQSVAGPPDDAADIGQQSAAAISAASLSVADPTGSSEVRGAPVLNEHRMDGAVANARSAIQVGRAGAEVVSGQDDAPPSPSRGEAAPADQVALADPTSEAFADDPAVDDPAAEGRAPLAVATDGRHTASTASSRHAEAPARPHAAVVPQVELQDGAAHVRLEPDELGPIDIRVERSDGALAIVVRAERADSAEMMRRNADLLQRELNDSGVTNARLDFGQGSGRQSGSSHGGGGGGPASAASDQPGPPPPSRRAGPGQMDLRV